MSENISLFYKVLRGRFNQQKKCSAFYLYVSTREKEYQQQKRGGRGMALVIMNNINIETKSEEEGGVV